MAFGLRGREKAKKKKRAANGVLRAVPRRAVLYGRAKNDFLRMRFTLARASNHSRAVMSRSPMYPSNINLQTAELFARITHHRSFGGREVGGGVFRR